MFSFIEVPDDWLAEGILRNAKKSLMDKKSELGRRSWKTQGDLPAGSSGQTGLPGLVCAHVRGPECAHAFLLVCKDIKTRHSNLGQGARDSGRGLCGRDWFQQEERVG